MQTDSVHFSTSGHMMLDEVVAEEESQVDSVRCSQCTLVFNSRGCLLKHLNQVHGLDVDAVLKQPEIDEESGGGGGSETKLSETLNEHEFGCDGKSENQNDMEDLNQHTDTTVISTDEHKEDADMPTSKTTHALNSAKDLKTYKRPQQTITKYFSPASGSRENLSVKSSESAPVLESSEGTIFLQESPLNSSVNSSGVFKVTAKSMIDMCMVQGSNRFLLDDHLFSSDLRPTNPKEQFKENAPKIPGKRTNSEPAQNCPIKRVKSDRKQTQLPEQDDDHKPQPSSSSELAFEFSDDEEEKKVNGDAEISDVYFCKHCDYSDVTIRNMSTHYQNDHPYVRHNAAYVQDQSDQSATFRCLDCPVEFLNVTDLKSHYAENHPQAPNVFTNLQEISLVFKCFICPFICSELKLLKEHYKQIHPKHKVENPLLYCKYSKTARQEESSQMDTCEKPSSPEESEGISPKNTNTKNEEVRKSPQHPTSKAPDVVLYHCNSCNFSHKSVVVVHVHYQKSHPEESVTIDKIKRSAHVKSSVTPEKSVTSSEKPENPEKSVPDSPQTDGSVHVTSQVTPEKSVIVSEKSENTKKKTPDSPKADDSVHVAADATSQVTPEKSVTVTENVPDSPKTDDAELSQQKMVLSLVNLKHTSEASKGSSESPKMEEVKSTEEKNEATTPPIERRETTSAGTDGLRPNSPNELFYCQFCWYSSSKVRCVVAHHHLKHAVHGIISTEEILSYSAEVQKRKLLSKAEASASVASSDSRQVENHVAGASVMGTNPFACPENLFYCQKCNFGHPNIKGVLNHQAVTHKRFNSSRECIMKHTTLVRDEIVKSKSHTKELSFSTGLPLPLMNEGDENTFFCHFCNYRHHTVKHVLRHSFKRHPGFEVTVEQIHQYTAVVLKQTQTLHPKSTSKNQDVNKAPIQKKGKKRRKTKTLSKALSVSRAPPVRATQPQRTLQCHRCTYTCQYVNILRRHMWTMHRSNRSASEILRTCYKRGMVQTGYHCDLCVFSHKDATVVHQHFQEEHAERKHTLEYITTKLYVGPNTCPPRKKLKVELADDDDDDGSLSSQKVGQNDTKMYSCKACSFKGSSVSSMTHHYRSVHPWSVKDDGSVLNVITNKKPSVNSHVEDYSEKPDVCQSPVETVKSAASSPEAKGTFRCQFCSLEFHSERSLTIHCGMKHQETILENLNEQMEQQVRSQTRVHVFKCPYCTYVNSNYQGVLTHCQMKHPTFVSRADSLHVDKTKIKLSDDSFGNVLRLTGYMCKTCAQIYATQEKLNKHCEDDHNETAANTLKPSNTNSPIRPSSPSPDASLLCKSIHAQIKCEHCSYICRTKMVLSRHMRVHHRNASVSNVNDCAYKCELCSRFYLSKKRLGDHYARLHGKEAFLKYYIPVYKKAPEKLVLTSTNSASTEQPESSSDACKDIATMRENKILIYKCPVCPYVNNTQHGTLTHCQMVHTRLLVRREDLETEEVLESKMFLCKIGKRSNRKGYMCKKCPHICGSLKKLKIHRKRDHKQAVSEHSTEGETEEKPDHESQSSFTKTSPSKNKTVTENDPSQQPGSSSSTMFKCQYCPMCFYSLRSVSIHCGMKHQDAILEQSQTRVHVFRCPYCAYVNTYYQGVLTHCQMKHPAVIARADSFNVDEKHLQTLDDCLQRKVPGEILKFTGYICETCFQIYASLEEVNKHHETDHEAASDTINPAPTISDTDETEEGESNTHSAPTSSSSSSSSSNTSLLRRKVYAVIKCQYCKYSCTTKIALSRHLLFHHRNSSNGNECVHKCELCSKSYFGKTNLAIHYSKSHGKDAFLKYYVPVYRQAPKQSDKPKVTATTEGNKILVYKCPRCPYVNASHHGTLTHCQKTHPSLVARADELKTEEVLEINMLRCEMGKNSNRRGYMCKKCPQIHATSKELKIHRKLDHNVAESATSEQSAQVETEEKPDLTSESQDSVTEAASHTSALNITETDPSRELVSTGRPVLKQNKDQFLYQCHLCSYIGARRRYLHSHYKKTHKFDAFTTCKLLQKYNKRKRNKVSKSLEATSEKNTENKCKTCPNTTFDSSQLLIDHYSNFHGLAGKLNFIVLSQASKTTREVYKCVQCSKRLNGNRNLRLHLDRHRAWKKKKEMALKKKASLVVMEKPEPTTTDVWGQDEQPVLQTAEELTQENVAGSTGEENVTPVAAVESFTESTSPVSSPPKPTDPEQQELESREDKRTCKQCGRSFMSLKGLRSHERSHAALAAIKKLDNLPTSALKYNVNKYIIYKPGTLRPFLCGFCSYRTTVLVLWTSHFRKKHQDVIVNAAQTNHEDEDNIQEPGNLSEENNFPEPDEEAVMTENPLYLEPPDVQRQLNHYNLMARTGVSSRTNTQEIELPETTLLHCEFCNFNTGHLSSVRRHYLNRHGKKIFRCKDCSFFTGLRKSLEEHVKTGHSTFQSEPTHHKILRCPFCLYQTKNKNSMIDHIVLHREERVVPIEVRRSKLSRYLQGIVFRCHKCTFTSGSAENLRLHMMRHDDIRPYKCRLCYFDCTLLSDLEAHLSDKHQVMRNHELVGQVSLDQLETRVGQTPEEEEEQFSNLEPDNNEIEDAEIETLVRDGNDIVREIEAEKPSENNIKKKTTLQVKDACQKHDPTESEAQRMDDVVEINVEDETSPESSDAEREGKTNEHPIQPKLRSNESSSAIVTEKKEETAEGSSSTCVKTEALKLNIKALQLRTLNIEARVENNILHHILVMDDDGGVSKKNKTADQDRTVKTGQNRRTETEEDNSEANNTRGQESFKIERHLLTLQPNCSQFKISHSEILGGSLMNCKDKQAHVQKTGEDVTDGYGEIPELESEYLTDGGCEEEEENDRLNQKRDEADDRDDEEGRRKNEADDPQVNKSAFEATGGASEVLCSSVTKNKLYTCEFCGRNLLSSSELKRHILRHGI